MSLKDYLNSQYQEAVKQASTSGKKLQFGEVEMFRAMRDYFDGRGCSIIETHQHRVQNTTTKQNCEISDLLIVSFGKCSSMLRATFLQAKKAKNNEGKISKKGMDTFKFTFDARQYHLLKECPVIDPCNTRLDPHILSNSCSPSITSYGVFYDDDKKKLDFAYEITQLLKPRSYGNLPVKSSQRICYFDTTEDEYGFARWRTYNRRCPSPWCYHHCCDCTYPHCEELLSTINAKKFENALYSFQIGSPLCVYEHRAEIQSILKAVNEGELKHNGCAEQFKQFVQQLLDRGSKDDNIQRDGDNNRNGDLVATLNPKYIILVNVKD